MKSRNIQWKGVSLKKLDYMWFKTRELTTYYLKDHDIVVAEGGEVGKASIWNKKFGEIYFQNSVNRIRAKNSNDYRYIYNFIRHLAKNNIFKNTVNRVSIAHLTKEKIIAYKIPVPTYAEQQSIAGYLDEIRENINKVIEKINTQIENIKEYRSSLIYHAVTGKIKI